MNTQLRPTSTVSVSHSSDEFASVVLSDDALTAAGMRRVSAFIRTDKSANAKRLQKARDAAAKAGLRQINVEAPIKQHDAVRSFAKELRTAQDARVALENRLCAEARKTNPDAIVQITSKKIFEAETQAIRRLNTLMGWRRFLAKLLGLL